jgi:hypothetical protein
MWSALYKCGGRIARRPVPATAAAAGAALVDIADGGLAARFATRRDKLPPARWWTEMLISVPKIVVFSPLGQIPLDRLPPRVTHSCGMVYSCTSFI